jgi:NADH-quinone oxidoreductase subunit N
MFVLQDLNLLKPELCLLGFSCILLIADLYLPQRRKVFIYLISQVAIITTACLVFQSFDFLGNAFDGQYAVDALAQTLKLIILGLVFIVFLYGRSYAKNLNLPVGEYHLLILFSSIGMMCLVSAKSLLLIYLGLELMALPLYVLIAVNRDDRFSVEASMKYFIMGALASGFLLYGMSFLYGITGSIQIDEISKSLTALQGGEVSIALFAMVFILAGLAFKFGLVPFHMWVPDVYQGSPLNITMFISSAPKIAAFGMAYRLLNDLYMPLSDNWSQLCLVLAIASLAIGNIVAIAQTSIRRLLAYSTIAHVGYLFLALLAAPKAGFAAALYYVVVYSITSVGAFGVIILMSYKGQHIDSLDDFKGLGKRSPWLAFLMLLIVFSLAGVPPTVGFFAKLAIIQALLDVNMTWVAIMAMAFSIIGIFYYLKIVRLMYFDSSENKAPVLGGYDLRLVLSLHGISILLLGVIPAPLFLFCQQAFL